MSFEEFEATMESLLDTLELELITQGAMESEGSEEAEVTVSASGIGAKFRSAFAKLKKGKQNNDTALIKEGREEIETASKELEEGEKEAKTPEQKKKFSNAAKIGLGAAAVIAAFIGLGAAADKAKTKAESTGEVKGVSKLLVQLYDACAKATRKAANKAGEVADFAERNDDWKARAMAKGRDKIRAAQDKEVAKYNKLKAKGSLDSVLTAMAFGLESVVCEDCDDDKKVEPKEGKAFDDEDLIEDANESELEELAVEAAVAVMLAEDGIDDSDLM